MAFLYSAAVDVRHLKEGGPNPRKEVMSSRKGLFWAGTEFGEGANFWLFSRKQRALWTVAKAYVR